jgi:VCBS repeat-containing protein
LNDPAPEDYNPNWDEPAVNHAPVLTAGEASNGLVEAGESLTHNVIDGVGSATVQLTVSDDDGDKTAYNLDGWLDAGNGVFTKDGTYGTASLDTATNVVTYNLHNEWDATNNLSNGAPASDTFTLSVNDGELNSDPVNITFDITGTGDWFEADPLSVTKTKTATSSSGNGQQTAETFNFHFDVEGNYLGYEGKVTLNADGDFTGANEQATVLMGGEIEDVFAGTGLLQLAGSNGGSGTEPGDAGYDAAHLYSSSDVVAGGFADGFVDLSVTLSGQVENTESTLTVTLNYDYWV